MKPIFNSLGSNYSLNFVWQSLKLIFFQNSQARLELAKRLDLDSNHQITLTYKGRHSLSLALSNLGISQGDKVLIQAFTCWAVEESIHSIGANPVFCDIGDDDLNLTVDKLKKALKKTPDIKALIVQHTLGFTSDIKSIQNWSREHNLILIEDLAHSYGAKSFEGKQLGEYGDAVALSFGRDKIIDAISGGAVIINRPQTNLIEIVNSVSEYIRIRDLLYPFVTQIIRSAYATFLGKYIHYLLKQTPLLVSPIANYSPEISQLPDSHATLVVESLENLKTNLNHRRDIAKIYQEKLPKKIQFSNLQIKDQACLRFPLIIKNRQKLFKYLKKHQIYLADTWFKSPVETGRLKVNSSYQNGSCPNAEKLSSVIVNLPTHTQVTKQNATYICKLINQFLLNEQ